MSAVREENTLEHALFFNRFELSTYIKYENQPVPNYL